MTCVSANFSQGLYEGVFTLFVLGFIWIIVASIVLIWATISKAWTDPWIEIFGKPTRVSTALKVAAATIVPAALLQFVAGCFIRPDSAAGVATYTLALIVAYMAAERVLMGKR